MNWMLGFHLWKGDLQLHADDCILIVPLINRVIYLVI